MKTMTKTKVTFKYPHYAYRWYAELGETRLIRRAGGKNYAIAEDGKIVPNTLYIATTIQGPRVIKDGDWVVYEKTDTGESIRVFTPEQFEKTFETYMELELGKQYETDKETSRPERTDSTDAR